MLRWLAVAGLAVHSVSWAQACDTYVGQSVTPSSFDSVAQVLRTIPSRKDEFETTAQFETRVASARSSIPDTVIIPGIFSPEYVTYDADTASLRVQPFALRNLNTDYARVFGFGTPLDGAVEYGVYDNRDVVVFQQETSTGTYRGTNAYGASVTVTEITRLQQAIFEGKGEGPLETLFANLRIGPDPVIGTIPMGIPEARAIKESGRVAFVVSPKWPYYAEGTRYWEPNITNRIDVTNPIEVIIGDIRCGLLMTASNYVVAAFETR
jgi:hypothetical protein